MQFGDLLFERINLMLEIMNILLLSFPETPLRGSVLYAAFEDLFLRLHCLPNSGFPLSRLHCRAFGRGGGTGGEEISRFVSRRFVIGV